MRIASRVARNRRLSSTAVLSMAIGATLCSMVLGESGSWTGTTEGSWSDAARWVDGIVADGTDSAATFNVNVPTSDITVTLDTARTIGNVTFADSTTSSAGSWILSGGNTLTLDTTTGTPTLTVNGMGIGKAANIALALAGTLGLTKAGTGMLVLSGNNAYAGLTTVSAGTLQATKTAALPGYNAPGQVSVDAAGTLTVNVGGAGQWGFSDINTLLANATFAAGSAIGFDTTNATSPFTYSNALTGTVGLTKAGAGTMVLTGAMSYVGNTTVTGGTLSIPAGQTLNPSGTLTVLGTTGQEFSVDGGSVTFSGTSNINGSNANQAAQAGRLTINAGSATFDTLRNDNQPRSIIRVNGGTLNATNLLIQRSSNSAVDYTSGFIAAGGTTNLDNAIIASNNSWGSMSVEGGTVNVMTSLTIGNQATSNRGAGLRVTDGALNVGELVLSKVNGTNANNVVSATFAGGVTTADKISEGFDNTVTGGSITVTIGGGTVYVGAGGIVKNATINPAFNLNSGVLGAKADFSSDSPFTLGTASTLAIKAADAADVPHNITLNGNIGGSGTLIKTGGGTLFLNGMNTYLGGNTVSAGALVGSAEAIRGDVANNGSVTFAQATAGTFGGVVSGSGSVTKMGPGILTLSSPQTYTGATAVSEGVWKMRGVQGTSGMTVANGAGLATFGGGATVSALTLGAAGGDAMSLDVNDGTGINPLTVTANNGLSANGTTTIAIGVAGITHLGLYTLVDYNGSIGGAGFGAFALGALPPRVAGTLFNNTANSSVDLSVTAVDFPRWDGTAATSAWDVNSTQNWKETGSGNTTVYLENNVPGDQVLFNDLAAGTTTVDVTATVTPTFVTVDNNTKNYTFTGSGKISGPTGLTKSGTGSLTIANTGGNNYTGATSMNGGTVILGADNVLSDASDVNVGAGTTLDTNGHSDTVGILTLNGGTIGGGGTLQATSFDLRAGSVTAKLSGSANIVKSTAGAVTLNTQADTSGTTTVQEGTLMLGTDNALSSNATLTLGGLATGGTVDLNGHGLTVGRLTSGASGQLNTVVNDGAAQTLTINGGQDFTLSSNYGGAINGNLGILFSSANGTLTLTGSSTFNGGVVVNNGGTLAIASDASLGAVPSTPTTSFTATDFGPITLRTLSADLSLDVNRKININGVTLNVDTNGSANTMTINGAIEGGFLTKVGNGTLVLTNPNNSFGSPTVSAGNLRVGANGALGTGGVTVGTASLQLGDGVTLSNGFTSTSSSAENQVDVPVAGATATYAGTMTATTGNQIRYAATGDGATLIVTGAASLGNTVVFNQGNIVFQSTGSLASSGQGLIGRPASGTQAVALMVKDNASVSFGGVVDMGNARSVSAASLTVRDSGTWSNASTFNLLDTTAPTATATINLDGGSFTSGNFLKTSTGTSQTAVINFNGGTLKPVASSSTFLPALAGTTGVVKAGGAVIDTNGLDATVAIPLVNDAGATAGLTKNGAGVLTLGAADLAGPLTVNAGSVALSGPASRFSTLVTPGGTKVDLTNKLLVLSSITDGDARAMLAAGRAGGAWTGAGLVSSNAAADANGITGIAYARASALGANSWGPLSVIGGELLLKYTYYGDLNMNGRVDSDDYALADRGLAKHLTGWVNGDVNYDNVVNSLDFGLIDKSFALQGGILSPELLRLREAQFGGAYVASLLASVPEPSVVGLLAVGSLLGIRRRRQAR